MAATLTLRPPTRFDRDDKARWKRALQAREAAGNPLKAGEYDALVDLVDARARLDVLRDMLEAAYSASFVNERHVVALSARVDSTNRWARQLARDLKLNE